MLQEKISEQEVTIVVGVEGILSDGELADAFTLVKVCDRAQLEQGLPNLETNRLNEFRNLRAALETLAKRGIRFAVEILEIGSPLVLQNVVLLGWDGQE